MGQTLNRDSSTGSHSRAGDKNDNSWDTQLENYHLVKPKMNLSSSKPLISWKNSFPYFISLCLICIPQSYSARLVVLLCGSFKHIIYQHCLSNKSIWLNPNIKQTPPHVFHEVFEAITTVVMISAISLLQSWKPGAAQSLGCSKTWPNWRELSYSNHSNTTVSAQAQFNEPSYQS